jgi:WD40 repeat protein
VAVCTSDSESFVVRSADSGEDIAELGNGRGGVEAVAFSPDGRLVGASCRSRQLVVWDVATQAPICEILNGKPSRLLVFSRDGTRIAAPLIIPEEEYTGAGPDIGVWDVPSGRRIAALTEPLCREMRIAPWIRRLAFSRSGRVLVSHAWMPYWLNSGERAREKQVCVWDIERSAAVDCFWSFADPEDVASAFESGGCSLASTGVETTVESGAGRMPQAWFPTVFHTIASSNGRGWAAVSRDGLSMLELTDE